MHIAGMRAYKSLRLWWCNQGEKVLRYTRARARARARCRRRQPRCRLERRQRGGEILLKALRTTPSSDVSGVFVSIWLNYPPPPFARTIKPSRAYGVEPALVLAGWWWAFEAPRAVSDSSKIPSCGTHIADGHAQARRVGPVVRRTRIAAELYKWPSCIAR